MLNIYCHIFIWAIKFIVHKKLPEKRVNEVGKWQSIGNAAPFKMWLKYEVHVSLENFFNLPSISFHPKNSKNYQSTPALFVPVWMLVKSTSRKSRKVLSELSVFTVILKNFRSTKIFKFTLNHSAVVKVLNDSNVLVKVGHLWTEYITMNNFCVDRK